MASIAATLIGLTTAGAISGLRFAAGQTTTATASDTIVTGLTTVVGALAVYDTDVALANDLVSASVGDQAGTPAAGSILIKTWKRTATGDCTPIAASAFSKKVNWLAWGT